MQIQRVLPEFTLSKTEGVEMTIEPKQGFSFRHYLVRRIIRLVKIFYS